MPRGDRTGPNGMGPTTGRAAGFCAGYDAAGWVSAPELRGRGRRIGRGFAHGRGFAGGQGFGGGWCGTPAAPQNRKALLQSEVAALENRLEYLRREIDAVDGEEDDPRT
jgi:hypothetical protein